ncbi:MAG: glucose-1-phosphate thymidylyltransferase [Armatimonadetes bacterium]|nr:glucose-1-phosphate thymidylyltransferase [Armatimonadota bacterium]
MKALILSGGKGTRLRPITYTGAKQLVPVANKPILFYTIEAVKGAGIKDIGIVVGETHEEVRAAVGKGERWGVKITYIHQDAPLGLAHAVKVSHDFLKDDTFVMYLGDNLIKDGIKALVEEYTRSGANSQILLAHVPNPREFGVAQLEAGRVVKLIEKPKNPPTDLALVGVYMFDKNIFEAVNSIKPSARGELEITDAIQYLVDHKYRVESHTISGWWKDTGKLEDMLEANRLILDMMQPDVQGEVDVESEIAGRVTIGKGSRIVNSSVRGPAIIGENCLIENAFIGPYTSINDRCKICASEIEHSIILEDSQVINIGSRLEDSLIGKNVRIDQDGKKPKAYRMMVGDNSTVSVI